MTRNYAYYIAYQSEIGIGSTVATVSNGVNTVGDINALCGHIANQNGLKQVAILSLIRLPGSDVVTEDEVENPEVSNEQA